MSPLEDRVEWLEDALQLIVTWSQAYPLDIFPEPDLKKAAELLQAGGITLDAVSASTARHIVTGIGRIALEALGETRYLAPQKIVPLPD